MKGERPLTPKPITGISCPEFNLYFESNPNEEFALLGAMVSWGWWWWQDLDPQEATAEQVRQGGEKQNEKKLLSIKNPANTNRYLV